MKTLTIILFVFLFSQSFAQIFTENFNYPIGDSLTTHGWTITPFYGGPTTFNAVTVSNPGGLTFPGYSGSGIGNAASVNTTGQDIFKSMDSVKSSGNVYTYFMMKVDTVTGTIGDWFFSHLRTDDEANLATFIRRTGLGFNLGFNILNGSGTYWGSEIYSYDSTYLVVLKYTFYPGIQNDRASMFVFSPSKPPPALEPYPTVGPSLTGSGLTDVPNFSQIMIRQGTASQAPKLIIDGIKVLTSWNNIPANNIIPVSIFEGYYNSGNDEMRITETARVYVRNSASPYSIIDSAKGTIDKVSYNGMFNFIQLIIGNYYIVMKQRNTIETWSKLPVTFYSGLTTHYTFVTSLSQAFGDNMKRVDLGPTQYGFYSGDVNQDGIVDASDLGAIDNDATNFVTGYISADLTGDEIVDASDAAIADNNAFNFVSVARP